MSPARRVVGHAAPGEQITGIYGSGRKKLLERFLGCDLGYELEDPVAYLE